MMLHISMQYFAAQHLETETEESVTNCESRHRASATKFRKFVKRSLRSYKERLT
jgi:hypothetical protein